MKPFVITAAATLCAVAAVLSTRLIVPAVILLFKAIEESFAPTEPALVVAPVAVVNEVQAQAAPKPAVRKARRRKPSAQTLAAIQAVS